MILSADAFNSQGETKVSAISLTLPESSARTLFYVQSAEVPGGRSIVSPPSLCS
ncbi:hypothetical protein [Metallosphaera yellowstonensis]|uniref:hypothetical protein n=1 Tax=Metallosphaera yellowstonensis TaxID=1111107 RepID=UPI000B224FF1|nr:hypothetical protein [Metallosphaera yellowstonensis]